MRCEKAFPRIMAIWRLARLNRPIVMIAVAIMTSMRVNPAVVAKGYRGVTRSSRFFRWLGR
jgi:hypothetical protein